MAKMDKNVKKTNSKYWQGYKEIGKLIHCCQKQNSVFRIVWFCPKKLNIQLPT